MAYNPWYIISYETILDMANWKDFCADTEKKIVAIFAWMPQTIMSIKHKGNKLKYEIYDNKALAVAVKNSSPSFEAISRYQLLEFDIDENARHLETLCKALFPNLGSVASSKCFHFSAPRLLPMWDRQLRLKQGLDDTPYGYIEYIRRFKLQLAKPENSSAALAAYPANAVRGWDIVCMENR
jgi:hypothetical protein